MALSLACSGGESTPGTTPVPGQGGAANTAGTNAGSGAPGVGGSVVDPAGGAGAVAGTGGGAGGAPNPSAGTGGMVGGGAPGVDPIPNKQAYVDALVPLVDVLVATQVANGNNAGALVSPSNNPDDNPIHSRAAEAVYPIAVAYKNTQNPAYLASAIALGSWLASIQQGSGAWSEDWPSTSGWLGTGADQLISLAGAYGIIKAEMPAQVAAEWEDAIRSSANWVEDNFPLGNINYQPTGAVALVISSQVIDNPSASWLTKAASLMNETLDGMTGDNLLTGEGDGVDLGYNIAQSIGFVAMYGILVDSQTHLDAAADMLRAHQHFMYPNGAIDNSWGTRSYKWMLESGTKTAPGIYFTFGLLADQDPSFQRGAQLALKFLAQAKDEAGWVAYGPHAASHPSANPPSNYSTFARAQSIATVVELGPEAPQIGQIPADNTEAWFQFFSGVRTGVGRSGKVMATVTGYKQGRYASSMVGGGSASAVWFEGYGPTGFIQVSGQTNYNRVEARHMPTESGLLPLTARIESGNGSNLAGQANVAFSEIPGGFQAVSTGSINGNQFTWTHQFLADSYSKTVQVMSGNNVRVVEPFVDNPGNQYAVEGSTFRITTAGGVWEVTIDESNGSPMLTHGENADDYWIPFPGIECYPLTINLNGATQVKYTVRQAAVE